MSLLFQITLEGAVRPLRVDYATGEKDRFFLHILLFVSVLAPTSARLMALGFFGPSAAAAAATDERVKLFVGNLSDGAF